MTDPTILVGGGIFGCWAALCIARTTDHPVILIERSGSLLSQASAINQARLHTGPHYPRSYLTAQRARAAYDEFRRLFPDCVKEFKHVYAIARHGSKTDGHAFDAHLERLDISATRIDPARWFGSASVESAWEVTEPSFDVSSLRQTLRQLLSADPRISVMTDTVVTNLDAESDRIAVITDNGTYNASRLVIASYASINPLRTMLNLQPIPLKHELAEVVLGTVKPQVTNVGFTVMDGPFWSLMPFGHSGFHSLTSVGLTPVMTTKHEPRFPCQQSRPECTPSAVLDCTTCFARPASLAQHQMQQMHRFLARDSGFTPQKSLLTVKTVLRTAEVDDARPTLVWKEADLPVTTIFSGKITSILELSDTLI